MSPGKTFNGAAPFGQDSWHARSLRRLLEAGRYQRRPSGFRERELVKLYAIVTANRMPSVAQ
jgi:hypothetical protein